jgi:CheY-like chemotaxis protein/HPt (histidine-containing phosphotransfer) domain-containing protein
MAEPGLSVLIVEDNPGDARLVEWALQHEPSARFRAEHVGRVAAAIERLAAGGVDAVLLDLGLPDSRGTDGVRRIRERAPSVAVIVLTGSEDPVLVRQAIEAGAQDYQVKGIFPPGHLTRILAAATERQRIEGDLARSNRNEIPQRVVECPNPVVWWPARGAPVASPAFLAVSGASAAEIAGAPEWLGAITRPALGGERGPDDAPVAGYVVPDGNGSVELEYVVRSGAAGDDRYAIFHARVRGGGNPAPVAPPTTERPIDEAAFAQLVELAGGDASFVPSLLDAFLDETRRLLPLLESGAERGDAASVTDLAHRLKSSCAQVGALGLSRRLAELERDGRAAHLEEIRTTARRVVRDYPAVEKELSARRDAARRAAGTESGG